MQRQATPKFFSAAGKHTRKKRARLKNFCINTDHLGNTRVSFKDADQNGAIDPDNEVVEVNDYYPYGMLWQTQDRVVGSNLGDKFRYNGKEMVDDIGLDWYDFGARNYSPELGRWMNVDALSEEYTEWSPYNYTLNNPILFIDPDGNYVDVSFIYRKNDEGEYVNQNLVDAFEAFATSEEGIEFLSNYAEEGQVIAGVEYEESGKFHKSEVDLGFGQLKQGDPADGRTGFDDSNGRGNLTIYLREKSNTDSYIEIIGHEGYVHADKHAMDYADDKDLNFSAGIDEDIVNYVESLGRKQKSRLNHHFQERRDKKLEKKVLPILMKYYNIKNIKKSKKDVSKSLNGFSN